MTLDVLSLKGQQTVSDEQTAVALFRSKFTNYQYVETPKNMPADVDAILMLDNQLRQVIETKCRHDCDMEKFMGQYKGQWLVTWEKIEKAKNIAKQLCIGLMGFLYIVPSKTLLVQRITDETGRLLVGMKLETTTTQATINGGSARRTNAYIDMTRATVIL